MSKAVFAEQQLYQLLSDDPERGIDALQSQYGGMIFRIISRILPEYPEDAEEVAADVLVAVWRQVSKLSEGNRPLGAWLTVTARNRAIDRRRLLTRKQTLPLNEEVDFLVETGSSDGEDLIVELVSDMSEPDREIFLRRYYRMETAQEIGAAMGMQAHTVNVRLARGRQKLKAEYLKQMRKENGRYAQQHGIS